MVIKESKDKKLENAGDIIEALSRIGEAITSDLYLEDILKLIVAVTAEVMDSKICSLMLLDPKTKELAIKATQSISREYIDKDPLKLGEGIAGKVAVKNKPEVVYNISEDKNYRYPDIAKKEGLVSLLCVPLHFKGKVVGTLTTYTSRPHHFSLESRKAVERAKGILMNEHGLTEVEAFKRIQKFAMNNRKSMREIADAIVLSNEMKQDHA